MHAAKNFPAVVLTGPRFRLRFRSCLSLTRHQNRNELERSPFLGAIFEGFVASEIVKAQVNAGGRRQLFYFRDQQGLEVDFVIPGKQGGVTLIEAKATRTPKPAMAEPLSRLGAAWSARSGRGNLTRIVVHRDGRNAVGKGVLAPGVRALSISELVSEAAIVQSARRRVKASKED
jgi:uncharacterized protein